MDIIPGPKVLREESAKTLNPMEFSDHPRIGMNGQLEEGGGDMRWQLLHSKGPCERMGKMDVSALLGAELVTHSAASHSGYALLPLSL